MTIDPFRIPTDAEIAEAEGKLGFKFPPAYVEFLKGGSNVANAVFEPAVILPGCSYLDIFEMLKPLGTKWEWQRNGCRSLKTTATISLFLKLAR